MADVHLVVIVKPAVAQDIRSSRVDEGPAKAITDTVRAAGATLTPLHPHTAGAALPQDMQSSFVLTTPAGHHLDALAERLRSLPGVEAAYVKPRDEAP